MDNDRRLIDVIFPLLEANIASKAERSITSSHPSTLHVWPARMVLAASRAVVCASLLKDPPDEESRKQLSKKIGSILKWKNEFRNTLNELKDRIIKEYRGSPNVIDYFAGSGSLILEALRMGCNGVASDYNPVAWFIQKCTIDFPFRFQTRKFQLPSDNTQKNLIFGTLQGDIADHVDYWQNWVFEQAKKDLMSFFPLYNNKEVATYFWARTVPCEDPSCGVQVPLIKNIALERGKDNNFINRKLNIDQNNKKIGFTINISKNKAAGIVKGAKAYCPLHPSPIGIEDEHIKQCGKRGKLNYQLTAIRTVDNEFYPPPDYTTLLNDVKDKLAALESEIPFGIPKERLEVSLGYRVHLYGLDTWDKLFTDRQMLVILTFIKYIRESWAQMKYYPEDWNEAIFAYLAAMLDKLVNRMSTLCIWNIRGTKIEQTLAQNTLPIVWDFPEANPLVTGTGTWESAAKYTINALRYLLKSANNSNAADVFLRDASDFSTFAKDADQYDLIMIDPPYYNAIGYAGLSDMFYIFLRKLLFDKYSEIFSTPLTPKSKEIIMDIHKNEQTQAEAKEFYEENMKKAFKTGYTLLKPDGRMVVIFAQKDPEAWVSIIRGLIGAGFVVKSSWPIQTSKTGGRRNFGRSSLGSTIWIICKKRLTEEIGNYRAVVDHMRNNIRTKLRYFWDNGIVGPDLLWTAVGPALESYSQYKLVERAGGNIYDVKEFLSEIRRFTTEFALNQVLKGRPTDRLDDISRYYLMHRQNFEFGKAPDGECILLAQALNLTLADLKNSYQILVGKSGSGYKLLEFDKRKKIYDQPPFDSPLVDKVHYLMVLWKAGNHNDALRFVEEYNLKDDELFWIFTQAIAEMIEGFDNSERKLLEGILNWGRPDIELLADKKLTDYILEK